jgi:ABC-type Fe3+/spermidine/putrescine transport system ATPase subunit
VNALDVAGGEFLVLVGPSGSGKPTALRMLAGLEDVDSGALFIAGRDVTNLAPRERDIAMVFQNYTLYPHMTVYENRDVRGGPPARRGRVPDAGRSHPSAGRRRLDGDRPPRAGAPAPDDPTAVTPVACRIDLG